MKKYDLRPTMKVQCGDLLWKGKAKDLREAVTLALSKNLPQEPSLLLRAHDGEVWQYLDFESALQMAGYKVIKTKQGFKIK